jgi:hypothetical protein
MCMGAGGCIMARHRYRGGFHGVWYTFFFWLLAWWFAWDVCLSLAR